MPTILDRILETKQREVAAAKAMVPACELERRIADCPPVRDFPRSLRRTGQVAIIAEVKKASPSAGVIRPDFDPVAIARLYEAHGAAAISVLTDSEYFQGHLDYLTAIKSVVRLPVLRKDFIIDRYQLLEARAAGADAVLLIAECLPGEQLATLQQQATAIGLHTLVELHDAEQLPRVLACGATIIGINNRDLRTFITRLDHTRELRPHIPPDRTVVSESGIRSHADLVALQAAGVQAVLVGESLMRAPDIGAALDSLRGGPFHHFPP
ncbi:MAG: indole-3-glycerol phosphate synthase TrpC [Gemmataceae bacterium]|nr:indole-3-glycerol phosphate synthase TrpC [Gemmata sp.]MDW8199537.1 indole-3-glycerol phosphate synthase TrpC [Gemmataceae bacterium]